MDDESKLKTEGQSGGVNVSGGSRVEASGDIVGRDKITIGPGAENVAINSRFTFQNDIRIGQLVIPARLILALVGVALVIALALWYVYVPAQMPLATFNVAVAEFGRLDTGGTAQSSDDGKKLSEWTYGRLKQETQNLPPDLKLTLWHDSLGWLEKRTTIGVVKDQAAAAQLAKQINAQVVIYGNLAANQNPATFTPTFYVRTLKGEADEIVGSQELGSAIAVQLPLDFNDTRVSKYLDTRLTPRADALLWFTAGLADDLLGDYGKAYQVFQQADKELTKWAEGDGREVLYYFIGREALFVSQDETAARRVFASSDDALDQAEKAFTRARDINPQYARAYFGLAQVDFQRGQRIIAARPSDPAPLDQARALLNRAIQLHQQALQLMPPPSGSEIEIKTRAALGATHFKLGESFLMSGDVPGAQLQFQEAIAELESLAPRIDPADYRTQAQTYAALGAAYYEQGHARLVQQDKAGGKSMFDVAIRDYQKCSDQADAFPYDLYLADLKSKTCVPQQAIVKQASSNLQ